MLPYELFMQCLAHVRVLTLVEMKGSWLSICCQLREVSLVVGELVTTTTYTRMKSPAR